MTRLQTQLFGVGSNLYANCTTVTDPKAIDSIHVKVIFLLVQTSLNSWVNRKTFFIYFSAKGGGINGSSEGSGNGSSGRCGFESLRVYWWSEAVRLQLGCRWELVPQVEVVLGYGASLVEGDEYLDWSKNFMLSLLPK